MSQKKNPQRFFLHSVKHCLDFFLCIFSSLTCLKKPVFSKLDLLWRKVPPTRLYWDLLTSGTYLLLTYIHNTCLLIIWQFHVWSSSSSFLLLHEFLSSTQFLLNLKKKEKKEEEEEEVTAAAPES